MKLNQIRIVPQFISHINSRDDTDPSMFFGNTRLSLPILISPMESVTGLEMSRLFKENGLLGCFSRAEFYKDSPEIGPHYFNGDYIVAVSTTPNHNYIDYLCKDLGVQYILIDTANGFNSNIKPIIDYIHTNYPNVFIIAGNVASKEGYIYLVGLGVDAIRIGIGTGSVCTTTKQTGIGLDLADSITECYNASLELVNPPLIIADGGIQTIGDIAKCLALGADLAMLGSFFAGTKETPGEVIKYGEEKYKIYRGSASYPVQINHKADPFYIEGTEKLVEYKGSAQKVINQIKAGLQSSMSYMGTKSLEEFKIRGKKCIQIERN